MHRMPVFEYALWLLEYVSIETVIPPNFDTGNTIDGT